MNHMCLLYRVLILQAAATDIRVRGLSFLDSEHMSAANQKNHKIPPLPVVSDGMSLLIIHSKKKRYQPPELKGEMWGPAHAIKRSKSSQHLRPPAFYLCPPRLVMSYTRIPRSPSQLKKQGSFNSKHPSPSRSKERKSPANVQNITNPFQSPRQSHPKTRTENPSRATAVFVGRIHGGPRRDQQLDHRGMATLSRPM